MNGKERRRKLFLDHTNNSQSMSRAIQMQIITTKINLLYDFIWVFLLRWRTVLSELLMTLRRWRRTKWSIDRSSTLWHFEAQEKVKNRMVLSTFAALSVNHFYHFSMSISSLFTFAKPQAFGFRSFQKLCFLICFCVCIILILKNIKNIPDVSSVVGGFGEWNVEHTIHDFIFQSGS